MASKLDIQKAEKSRGGAARMPTAGGSSLLDLRNQMDRMFDEFMSGWRSPLSRDLFAMTPFQAPAIGEGMIDVHFDVSESDEGLELTAELPGIEEKDVEISLDDGVLTVRGEKKFEKETKERDYHLSERRYGHFSRAMRLPDSVDQDQIRAGFDKGVLSVMLPKRPEAKARKKKIEISKG